MSDASIWKNNFVRFSILIVSNFVRFYSILNSKSKNPGVVTLQKLCDGLDISLRQFFDSPLFDNLEQEIK